jgi:AraC family transcriptional regulator of adaptative response/methylated-DNA-[protein]-cysteine methyltransferase
MEAVKMTETTPYSNPEDRWRAVLERDRAADGAFYIAVRSTRVYCRPSCPSRRPRRENVSFFDTAETARAAGYRACLRCHPDGVSAEQRLVAAVASLIESAETAPTLEQLARATGVSPAHLQRTFKRATGLSPRQYAASLRGGRFRERLRGAATVTEAVYDAGFGSSRAAYEEARGLLAMRPSAYRRGGRGERIVYAYTDGPAGPMLVAATALGVCAVYLGAGGGLLSHLSAEFPHAALQHDPSAMAPHLEAVRAGLSGGAASGVPLDERGTAFQRLVWEALRAIPRGETRTYSEIAAAIGRPGAARAVARACATNPLALLTPCHRVVRRDGGLGGYRWGIERKQALLQREGAVE